MTETQKVTLSKRRTAIEERGAAAAAREAALAQRSGQTLHPVDWLTIRFERFAEVLLGERRYLDYADLFLESKESILDQMEERVAQQEFGLSRPGNSKLVVPK